MKQKVRRALAVSGMAIMIGTTGVIYSADASARDSRYESRISCKKSFRQAKNDRYPLNENEFNSKL